MLIEFSVENFLSFKEKTTFSMVASGDKELPENLIDPGGNHKFKLLKTAAIYGANASGKSNFLRAFRVFGYFAINSVNLKLDDLMKDHFFALEQQYKSKPTSFSLSFIYDSVRYEYGYSVQKYQVISEYLYSFPKNKKRRLLERNNSSNAGDLFYFSPLLEGNHNKLKEHTRNDSLFLTVASQLNHKFFSKIVACIQEEFTPAVPSIFNESGVSITSRMILDEENKYKDIILDFLRNADPGISSIHVEAVSGPKLLELAKTDPLFPDRLKEDLQSGKHEKKEFIRTVFTHSVLDMKGDRIEIEFDHKFESQGTMNFYQIIGWVLVHLTEGFTLFIDELEPSLHPNLAEAIIRLFHNPKTNPHNAQLIFTTHNVGLLDAHELFRRDQIWFTEKREDGSTDLYSLWDFEKKPRKGENLRKGYQIGRYGAVPKINLDEIAIP